MPVRRIFPLEPVDDRVKTHGVNGNTDHDRLHDFVGQFMNPFRAPDADVTCLGDEDCPPVALVDLFKK
jgi:hypothetical protein